MKAVVWTKYGGPEGLELQEVEKPAPKDNEVLIKIHATTVTAGDCEMRSLKLPALFRVPMRLYVGLTRPKRIKILGMEIAGKIEKTGKDVTKFKAGDMVFASTATKDFTLGEYAEYRCLPEDGLIVIKPENISYEEAASIPVGGMEGLQNIRKANVTKGKKILINGAGGTIGTYAVQIARYYGAEVTAVDSAEKFDIMRSIGADYVIDYTKEDFTKNGKTYDAILDVVGKSRYSRSIRSLKKNGRLLIANPKLLHMIRGLWTSLTSSKKVITGAMSENVEDLQFLTELVEKGKLKPVIDKTFPLEQIVEAHTYVESGQKKGNVVINVISELVQSRH